MNLPNKLSILRIVMVPLFVVAYFLPFEWTPFVALCIFALAAITDFLDGYIARKYNLVTNLGKLLDPIADKILVCAAKRGSEVVIPDGNFVLQAGDRLHVAAAHQDIKNFFKAVGQKNAKVKNVLLCGGGRLCFYLAAQLLQAGMQVKIIEQNEQRCEELSDYFPRATIIHGDATDHELLLEEGIRSADAFVAITNNDEENIIDENEAQLLEAMSVEDEELPVYKAYAGKKLEKNETNAKMIDIVDAIKTVFDPEIPINVYDLGLIYKINQNDNGDIHIDMSLTAPGCPVAGVLPQQVADAVAVVKGVGEVEVEVVWEPAWTLERLSEEARMMLEMI